MTYQFDVYFREVLKPLPLFLQELLVAHDHHGLELLRPEAASTQRHHEVTQTNGRTGVVGKHAQDDVVLKTFQHFTVPVVGLKVNNVWYR